MKIGVRPHDLEFTTTEELISLCTKYQIDGLQLVCLRTYPQIMNAPAKIDAEIQKLLDNQIEIFLLGSYFNMIHPDDEKLQAGKEIFTINTGIAQRNGLVNIGSETGSVNGDAWTYHPDNHTESSYQKLEQSINEITKGLEGEYYLLEPVYDHVAYNLELTKRMILNDRVAITLDLANLLNKDNAQDYLEIFESFLATFRERIRVFHFKNFNLEAGNKVLCQLDQGIIDYELILPLIEKYQLTDIPVIVEEIQNEELFNSINYLRKLEEK